LGFLPKKKNHVAKSGNVSVGCQKILAKNLRPGKKKSKHETRGVKTEQRAKKVFTAFNRAGRGGKGGER